MIEWPLIFLGGLLGSSHCIGMCGALAISVGLGAQSLSGNLRRQALYTLGRLNTYAFLGATAGYAGWRISKQTSLASVSAQTGLALIAGVLLVWQGLVSAGVLSRRRIGASTSGFCPARGVLSTFLTAPGWYNAFLAGLLTGFLPCGLVYAYVAFAASTGRLLEGMLAMVVFGAGTAPLMILTGTGASALTLAGRQRLLRAAAWCVVMTGALTVFRGLGAVQAAVTSQGKTICPWCESASDTPGDRYGNVRTRTPP